MKLTKRKAFNFLRSYFDVLNKLEKDTDKLDFLLSVINKQFLDEDPKDLDFIPNLCYESQRHAIESSIKGWKRANKTDVLGNPLTTPPTNPMTTPPTNPKEEEVEEEVEVEVEEEVQHVYNKKQFLNDWNILRTKHLKKPSFLNSLNGEGLELLNDLNKDYKSEDIKNGMVGLFKQKQLPNGNTTMQSNPIHFLKFFNSYLTAFHDTNDMLYGKKDNQ